MRRGITCSVFLGEVGVLGILRASQKSSASQPVRYPCLVRGVDSGIRLCVLGPFPLFCSFTGVSSSNDEGLERQMN
jgi:hypothetical protein